MTNDVLRLANAGQPVILPIASDAAIGFIVDLAARDALAVRGRGAPWRARRRMVDARARRTTLPRQEALSPSIPSAVYGVEARIERGSRGCLLVIVEGPSPTEIRHAS